MSLFLPKLPINEMIPMDLTADTPDPLDTVPEATEGLVISSPIDQYVRIDSANDLHHHIQWVN